MKTVYGLLTFLFFFTATQAQRICSSVEYAQKTGTNASTKKSIDPAAQHVTHLLRPNTPQRDTITNEIIQVPVVIHVLFNTAAQNISDAQIQSQLAALNKDFSSQNEDRINTPAAFKHLAADIRIQFCLAQVDAAGNRTTGIIRKQTNAISFTANDAMKNSLSGGDNPWDSKRYLNIWVCSLGGRSLGYATAPGTPADKDGVVIAFDAFGTVGNVRAPFNKGRTAAHEIGHWLGLQHLWGDTNCGDDNVEDTPQQQSYNFGCPSFPRVSSCSPNGNGDMFMNYMDFSDDACMNMFTSGQKNRMRALFATGNSRNSFLTSFACDSNLVQAGPIVTPAPEPAPIGTAGDIFKVYPNPVQSVVTIEYKPAAGIAVKSVGIYTAVGVNVFTGTLSKEKNTLDLSQLTSGIYIIRIGEGSSVFTTKIFKL